MHIDPILISLVGVVIIVIIALCIAHSEPFNTMPTVYVFLSKHCPHCVNYANNEKANVEQALKNKATVVTLYSDDDKAGLFQKYDIQYVPACVVIQNNITKKINGPINTNSILKAIN